MTHLTPEEDAALLAAKRAINERYRARLKASIDKLNAQYGDALQSLARADESDA